MNAIIGLFSSEEAVYPTVERLKEAGVADERISILSNPSSINQLLGCNTVCVIKNYAVSGAAIGMGIYAIFGVAAALCECNFLQFGQEFGIGTFLGAALAGTFVGGFLGILAGVGKSEEDSRLYSEGVRTGGKIISIQVLESDAERVKNILVLENATGVKMLQPRGS